MKICKNCDARFNNSGWLCPSCHFKPEFTYGHYRLDPVCGEGGCYYAKENFARFFELEDSNFWFRSRSQLIFWVISKYFHKAQKMLEVGCGTGFVLSGISRRFPHLTLVGSDNFSEGLFFAAQRLVNVELIQFDAAFIPFENEFDIIGAFDVLEHVDDDKRILEQMYKATAWGGGIIVAVPQHSFLWSKIDERAHHKRRYDAKKLIALVSSVGFDVVRTMSFVSLLFPVMILSRLIKQYTLKDYDVVAELTLPGLINKIFEQVLRLERLMIQSHLMMPFGGSFFLIAQKTR